MLVHYGSFEKTFLKRMCERHGGPPEHSAAGKAIASSVNLLSLIYARIYFPAYSNGLKEIARFLGFEWTDPSASGLLSIAWRSQWEKSQNASWRDRLVAYNADDCEALSLVARTIVRLLLPDGSAEKSLGGNPEIVHAEELGRNNLAQNGGFSRARCRTWSISTRRRTGTTSGISVFVRTGMEARPIPKRPQRTSRCRRKAEKTLCPNPRPPARSAASGGGQRADS